MDLTHYCPECGKPMAEEPKWRGLWTCPDSKVRLNSAPPYQFKCNGLQLTDEGAALFHNEMLRLVSAGN